MRRSVGCLLLIFMILFGSPASISAQSTVDADGVRWTVAGHGEFEAITGEDQGYLNVIVDADHYRLSKDLSGGLQPPTKLPMTVSGDSLTVGNCQAVAASSVQIKGQHLYCGQESLLDISLYQKQNEEFSRAHSELIPQAPSYKVYAYTNRQGNRLYIIVSNPAPAVPAPYTSYYCDLVYWQKKRMQHLTAVEGLRPRSLFETEDGSLWVTGTRYSGRFAAENSLLRINAAGRCQSINQTLRNNDIKWLGCQGKRALVWAATRDFYQPADPAKYDKKAERVLWVEASGKTQARTEKIAGFTDFYRSSDDHLFGISSDRQQIMDLSKKRSFSLAEAGSEYTRLEQLLEKADSGQNATIPQRPDVDGSIWYINTDQRIVHVVNGHEVIFNQGPPLLMTCLKNLFVDKQGRKWFVSVAGIACYESGAVEARYISPGLPAAVRETDKMHLVVDDQGQIWLFGPEIQRAPYGASDVVKEFDADKNGFKPVYQPYLEWDDQVYFAYQKENVDHSVCLRVYHLSLDGSLEFNDYSLPSLPQNLFVCEKCLFLTLPDGFCRIEQNQARIYRNAALLNMQHFPQFMNSHYLIFSSAARMVAVEIPDTVNKCGNVPAVHAGN